MGYWTNMWIPEPPEDRKHVGHKEDEVFCVFCNDTRGELTHHDYHTVARAMRGYYPQATPKQIAAIVEEYKTTPVKIITTRDDDMCWLCAAARFSQYRLLCKWNPHVVRGGSGGVAQGGGAK